MVITLYFHEDQYFKYLIHNIESIYINHLVGRKEDPSVVNKTLGLHP